MSTQAIPSYNQSQLPPVAGPAAAPAAGKANASLWGCLSGLLLLLLIGAFLGRIWWANQDHIDNVAVGDCVQQTPDDADSPYRIVACEDPASTYKALKLIPSGGNNGDCKEVAGASQSTTNKDNTVCLGEKDVDPAKAVNVAKEGDCLGVQGSKAQRLDCSAKDAQYKVLKLATDVGNITGNAENAACRNVKGTESVYSWNWETSGTSGAIDRMSVDLVLCLGKK
jgi:hypothetical protein